jgi:hypothetical protein
MDLIFRPDYADVAEGRRAWMKIRVGPVPAPVLEATGLMAAGGWCSTRTAVRRPRNRGPPHRGTGQRPREPAAPLREVATEEFSARQPRPSPRLADDTAKVLEDDVIRYSTLDAPEYASGSLG